MGSEFLRRLFPTVGVHQTRGGSGSDLPGPDDGDDDDGTSRATENCVFFAFVITWALWLETVRRIVKEIKQCAKRGFWSALVCWVVGILVIIVVSVVFAVIYVLLTVFVCGRSGQQERVS